MNSRVSQSSLARLVNQLSRVEWGILDDLARFRLMTSGQIRRLYFTSHPSPVVAGRATSRCLTRLSSLGLVRHLQRRIGGTNHGSDTYTWHLSAAGFKLAATHNPSPPPVTGEPSLRAARHTLTIAETYTRLAETLHDGHLDTLGFVTEPGCWRAHINPWSAPTILKPDALATTATPGSQFEHLWFLEIDLSTESATTITNKTSQYHTYYHTGTEQAATGTFPHIIWITPDTTRANTIRDIIGKNQPADIPARLHQTMTLNQYIQLVQRE